MFYFDQILNEWANDFMALGIMFRVTIKSSEYYRFFFQWTGVLENNKNA